MWVGLLVGSTGALVYNALAWVLEFKMRIDDPLGAAPLHLGSGAWGMIMVSFFANPTYLDDESQAGIFYGGNEMHLAWHLAGVAVDFTWTMGTCSLMFWTMNYFGIFRVSEEAERMVMDAHHHSGASYIRGSVVSSTKSSMLYADKIVAKDEEKKDDNVDDDANADDNGDRDHGDQNQDSNKNKNETRTRVVSREGMRR